MRPTRDFLIWRGTIRPPPCSAGYESLRGRPCIAYPQRVGLGPSLQAAGRRQPALHRADEGTLHSQSRSCAAVQGEPSPGILWR